MSELARLVARDLAAYYEMVREQTHQWVDPLTEEQLWKRPFAHGNSAGHLLLHMTGNLNYYIGARVDDTGYVRDRDREFTEPEPKSKAEVLAAFPRLKFKSSFVNTCADVARRHPRGASRGFMRDIAERYVPDFKAPNICDLIEHAPFDE